MPQSRRKGKTGEYEVRDLLRAAGYAAARNGQISDWGPNEDLDHDVAGVHFEVKRRETLALPAWTRQAEEDAGEARQAVVVYRRSREPWRASVDFKWLLELLRTRDLVDRLCSMEEVFPGQPRSITSVALKEAVDRIRGG